MSSIETIDTRLIAEALSVIQAMSWSESIPHFYTELSVTLTQKSAVTPEKLAKTIGAYIQRGDQGLPDLRRTLGNEIKQTAKQTQNRKLLKNLKTLLGSVLVTIFRRQDLNQVNYPFAANAPEQAWILHVWLDAHMGERGRPTQTLRSTTNEYDHPIIDEQSTAGIRMPQKTRAEPTAIWNRVYEIVCDLAAKRGRNTPPFPHEGDEKAIQKFEDYCKYLNLAIDASNESEWPSFVYSSQVESEPVQDQLVRLYPDLRFFLCCPRERKTAFSRINEERLETWIAEILMVLQSALERTGNPEKKAGCHFDIINKHLQNLQNELDTSQPLHDSLQKELQTISRAIVKDQRPSTSAKNNLKTFLENVGLGEKIIGHLVKLISFL